MGKNNNFLVVWLIRLGELADQQLVIMLKKHVLVQKS